MKPNINVTPLIDVLLVLLIIFMVITPSKPTRFETKIPAEPEEMPKDVRDHPNTLIVTVREDKTLQLNRKDDSGSIENPEMLIAHLKETFKAREKEGIMRPNSNEIERTVFIRAPQKMDYGSVAKTVDAVKSSGASPIGLQIDFVK